MLNCEESKNVCAGLRFCFNRLSISEVILSYAHDFPTEHQVNNLIMNRRSLSIVARTIVTTGMILFMGSFVLAQEPEYWIRHSAISPDGKWIAFGYQGDLFMVPTEGGLARPLTVNDAWDGYPTWSRDGSNLAFASDRHGNLDLFLMAAEGGKARRLTYHSADDIPADFSVDGEAVLFKSARDDAASASVFPTPRLAELYEVRATGGTPRMVSTIPASQARYSVDGKEIVYRDEKAYESEFRKHDISAFARDIWMMNVATGRHSQLTRFKGGDHNPALVGGAVFYLSEERTGTFNVWSMDSKGGNRKQISDFSQHPVRHLSAADDGRLCYTHHGHLYTQTPRGQPKAVAVIFKADAQANDYQTKTLTDISEFAVAPSGKEIAIVARGEVFVVSRDFGTTVRITDTAEQERSVSFSNDGRTLLYAGERNGKWRLYEATLSDAREKYFFTATKIEEREVHSAETESFQPLFSPDGTKIAFLAGRDEIQILERATGDTHVALGKQHNYSYSDGDISFAWSADSKWLTSDFASRGRLFIPNIGVFPSDGSEEPVDVSHSGYQDSSPAWNRSGNVVYWATARFGRRDHGSWGREYDVMAAFLTQDAYDQFALSKEEYELAQDLKKSMEGDEDTDEAKEPNEVVIEWANLDDRTVRLTKDSANITQSYLVEDASKLFFLKRHSASSELWMRDFREDNVKLLKKLDKSASFDLSKDEKTIFFLSGNTLSHASLDAVEDAQTVNFRAMMTHRPIAERAYMFEHGWRQIKDKFYKRDFHGVDWLKLKKAYETKLPSITNTRDLANLMAEMTGELNASHIGVGYRPAKRQGSDETAALGLLLDRSETSGPLLIEEVLDKSPLKKMSSQIDAGMKLTGIDGESLNGNENLSRLLNHKVGKRVRLSISRGDGTHFEQVTIPISREQQNQLLYERWVKTRRELVEKLSDGRLGYVHVRGMNDESFRAVYSELLGQYFDKEAVVVDTRWNGGGWLHNDLAKLLMGEEYVTMHVRGREYRGDSLDQWNKPSILVMGEGNYSDAHAFPFTYDVLNIGEMVGMPVPGTMTAVWWEMSLSGDIRVGVPQVGMKNKKGEYLENNQIEPDYRVKNDPESVSKGRDKQIETAVKVMLKRLNARRKK